MARGHQEGGRVALFVAGLLMVVVRIDRAAEFFDDPTQTSSFSRLCPALWLMKTQPPDPLKVDKHVHACMGKRKSRDWYGENPREGCVKAFHRTSVNPSWA